MTEVEIAIYTHRWSQLQVSAIEGIARHTKTRQYSIVVTQKPGNCHQNMNRVWRRCSAPYVVLMDEDAWVLQDGWLDALIANLDDDPELGVVGCREIKDPALALTLPHPEPKPVKPIEKLWIPAYVMAFKRERVAPFLRFDEAIPGDMGMTDTDACLQIRLDGRLKVGQNPEVVVYHPARDDDETRIREQRPFTSQQKLWFVDQVAYMRQKWGAEYERLLRGDR